MSILKPILVLVILSSSLVCNYAWATEPQPAPNLSPNLPPLMPARPAQPGVPAPVLPPAWPGAQAGQGRDPGMLGTALIAPRGRLCKEARMRAPCV